MYTFFKYRLDGEFYLTYNGCVYNHHEYGRSNTKAVTSSKLH